MARIFRWLGLTILIVVVCGMVAIPYWRDTQVDVSPSTMIQVLIILPLAIIASVYGLTRLYAYYKKERNEDSTEAATDDNTSTNTNNLNPQTQADGQWLNVLATALVTPLGNSTDQIIAGLNGDHTANADPILRYQENYPYLSHRIKSIPPLTDDEKELAGEDISPVSTTKTFAERTNRVKHILDTLFEQMGPVLQSIPIQANDVGVIHLNSSHNPQQAIKLHPAWVVVNQSPNDPEKKPVKVAVALSVVFLLPQHIPEDEQFYLQHHLIVSLNECGIDEQQSVSHTFIDVATYEDTLKVFNETLSQHLKHDHKSQPQILLIMGVDSWIDQAFLDQSFKLNQKPAHPSEAGFAVLIADQHVTTDLKPMARLTAPILFNRTKPVTARGQINAEGLVQSVDLLHAKYGIKKGELIEDGGVLLTDHRPMQYRNITELMQVTEYLNLEPEQLLSVGSLLNDSNVLTAGLSLTLAITHAAESELATGVIQHAGDHLRLSWLATPFPLDDVVSESDDIIGVEV